MNDASFPPQRRWFQFRLRTLLVAMMATIAFAYWIGSNLNVVRQREAIRESGKVMFGTGTAEVNERILRVAKPTASSISPLRRFLGDEPAEAILVREDADFERIVLLFPEATVARFNPPKGWPLQFAPA